MPNGVINLRTEEAQDDSSIEIFPKLTLAKIKLVNRCTPSHEFNKEIITFNNWPYRYVSASKKCKSNRKY